jgi:hypothetical protein
MLGFASTVPGALQTTQKGYLGTRTIEVDTKNNIIGFVCFPRRHDSQVLDVLGFARYLELCGPRRRVGVC